MNVPLFTPYAVGPLALANRIVVSPMCQYSAHEGRANDWHLAHWTQMLQSGAGLMMIEATAVTAQGRITPGCLGLYDDACAAALADHLARARALAPPTHVAIQLAHAGRKGSSHVPWDGGAALRADEGAWQTLAPSALPYAEGEPAPRAFAARDFDAVKAAFVAAATRAATAGIDAVELHMAHGYLLHEFLSPLANQRTDCYGGDFEGRARFPLEVFAAVRDAWPDARPLGVRLSATDWVDGGWTLDESIALALRLRDAGAAWIDVSSGGVSPRQKIPLGPGYQVPLAQAIRAATGLPTIAVGLITDPLQANAIVADGAADLVALARALLWNPRWPWHAAAALGATVAAPPQYWRSAPRGSEKALAGAKIGMR
ncbi:MAG: NADH:flavin oxidoreductase/NADH oxidase [Proteobacteria bacterium]|nr:NADH:flavin oxidoreductase/NADH oxidase [Pseudomonadota bacterium]